jgi:hypothetical protein
MSEMPPNSGACCLPNADGITYIKIGVQGHTVGMRGLDTVFQQLLAVGRQPEDATDTELIVMARKSNYIPYREIVEADYAAALRRAYAAFYIQQEQKA